MELLKEWKNIISFGKHNGISVEDVCYSEIDASYLVWLIGSTNRTDFGSRMKSEIYSQAEQQGDSFYYEKEYEDIGDWGDRD